jgi:flagellar basal body-associated protein FliL
MSVPSSKNRVRICWIIHVGVLLLFVGALVLPMCRVVSGLDLLPSVDKLLPGNSNQTQLGTVLIGAVVAAGLGMKPPLLTPGQKKMVNRGFAGLGDMLTVGIQPPGKTRKHLALLYLVVYSILMLATWVIWIVWHYSATLDAPKFPVALEDFKYDSVALIFGALFSAFRDPGDYTRTPYRRGETSDWPE